MIERVIQLLGADDKSARPLPDRWWRTDVILSVALTAMALVAIPIIPRPDTGTAVPLGQCGYRGTTWRNAYRPLSLAPAQFNFAPNRMHSWGYWQDDLRQSWPMMAVAMGATEL